MMAVPYTVSSGPGGDPHHYLRVREAGERAVSHTPTFQHFKSNKGLTHTDTRRVSVRS